MLKEKMQNIPGAQRMRPGHHDEHGGREVHAQDVGAKGSRDPNLKSVHTVVA